MIKAFLSYKGAPVADYESGTVSKKFLRIVLSYVDYINRTVWSK